MRPNTAYVLLAIGLATCLPKAVSAKDPPSAIVQVGCTDPDPKKHDSITEALATPARQLTIVIDGICIEDVVIRRDFVTIRGKNQNPDLDGIHSATPGMVVGGTGIDELGEAVVTVLGGDGIRFEHLFIGEGEANRGGVTARRNSIVTLTNCRVENNPDFGVAAAAGSVLFVVDSTVTGNTPFGGISVAGRLLVTDSSLFDGILSFFNGQVTMSGGSLDGGIFSLVNSTVELGGFGLAGVPHNGPFNLIAGDSSIRALSGSTLQGLTLVQDFSNLVLRDGSSLDGSLSCSSGGDAYCDDPTTQVTGDSNCGQCVKP